jgi:transposase
MVPQTNSETQADQVTAVFTGGIRNTKGRPKFFPKKLYKLRARVEQLIGKLKRFKRIAMRCEKTQQNYAAFIALACVFLLVKSVHTA